MKKITDSIYFRYLAIVLSILLALNLIPESAFRVKADTLYEGTIELCFDYQGNSYLAGIAGQVEYTNDAGGMETAYIGGGTATLSVDYNRSYTITILPNNLNADGYFCQEIGGETLYLKIPVLQNVIFSFEESTKTFTLQSPTFTITPQATSFDGVTFQVGATEITDPYTVEYLSDTTVTVSAKDTYRLTSVTVDGTPVEIGDGTQPVDIDLVSINANHAIAAAYEDLTTPPQPNQAAFLVDLTDASYGTAAFYLNDTEVTTVDEHTENVELRITPNNGYYVTGVTLGSEDIGASVLENLSKGWYEYKIPANKVEGNVSVNVTMAPFSYTPISFESNEYFTKNVTINKTTVGTTVFYVIPTGNNQFSVNFQGINSTIAVYVNADSVFRAVTNSFSGAVSKTNPAAMDKLLVKTGKSIKDVHFFSPTETYTYDETNPTASLVPLDSYDVNDYILTDSYPGSSYPTAIGGKDASSFSFRVADGTPSGEVEKASGVASVYYKAGVYNDPAAIKGDAQAAHIDAQSPNSLGLVEATISEPGEYSFVAFDYMGNPSNILVVNFVKDETAPSVATAGLYSDSNGTTTDGINLVSGRGYVSEDTMYLILSASDDVSGAQKAVLYTNTGSGYNEKADTDIDNGVFCFTLAKEDYSGYTNLMVKLIDAFGNESELLPIAGNGLLAIGAVAIGSGEVSASYTDERNVTRIDFVYSSIPSFVFTLTDSFGSIVTDVVITVNGTVLTADATGKAIASDTEYDSGVTFTINEAIGADLIREGENVITIQAKNDRGAVLANGNYSYTFGVDTKAPTVSQVTLNKVAQVPYVDTYPDEVLYVDRPFTVTITATDGDMASGVDTITVYDGDTLIASASAYDPGNPPTLTIAPQDYNASSAYEMNLSVVVTDKFGNTSEKIALTSQNSDLKSGKVYMSDSSADKISCEINGVDQYDDGTVLWTKGVPNLNVSISDIYLGISGYTIKVNDEVVLMDTSFDANAQRTSSLTIPVDASDIPVNDEGIYNIYVEVVNRIGKVTTDEISFHVDTLGPTYINYQFADNGSISCYSFANYVKDSLEFSISAQDAGCGVSELELQLNGEVIDAILEGRNGDVFEYMIRKELLKEKGEGKALDLRVVPIDYLGNRGNFTALYLNKSYDHLFFHFDSIAPVVSTDYSDDNLYVEGNKHWLPAEEEYTITATDTLRLKNILVKCNGHVILGSDPATSEEPLNIVNSFLTSYSKTFTLGDLLSYCDSAHALHFEVTVYDCAENEVTYEETLYVDNNKPVITQFEFSCDDPDTMHFLKFGTFANGKVKVSVHVSDATPSAGLKKVMLTADKLYVADVTEYKNEYIAVFTIPESALLDGTVLEMLLSAKVEDNVGNVSDEVTPNNVNSPSETNRIVIENKKPGITVTRDSNTEVKRTSGEGASAKDWYSGNVDWVIDITDADAGIASVKVTINGQELSLCSDGTTVIPSDLTQETQAVTAGTYRVSTSQVSPASDCSYKLTVTVTDNAGNVSEVAEDTIYQDATKPSVENFEISVADSTNSYLNLYPYGTFANGNLLVKVTAKDNSVSTEPVSGLDKINLYINGALYASGIVTSGNEYTFTVPTDVLPADYSSTMVFSAEAVDVSGLVGTMVTADASTSNLQNASVLIENTAPSASIEFLGTGIKTIDGAKWDGEEVAFAIHVTDAGSKLAKLDIYVNGVKVTTTPADPTNPIRDDFTNITALDERIETVNLNLRTDYFTADDGVYVIKIVATDLAGNKTEYEDTVRVDRHDPTVESFLLSVNNSADTLRFLPYGTFANGQLLVTVAVSDEAPSAGLDKVLLTVNGETYEAAVENGKAVFCIPQSSVVNGTVQDYAVSAIVFDKYGKQCTAVSLDTETCAAMQNNLLEIEKKLPTIAATATGDNKSEASGKTWYSSDVSWNITVNDENSGLQTILVKINDTEISKDVNGNLISGDFQSAAEAVKTLNFTVDTTQAAIQSDGSYTLSVLVTDNAGNNSEVYTTTVYVDKAAPQISKFKFATEGFVEGSEEEAGVTITDYGFYFTKDATVTITANDPTPGIGVKSVTYYLHDLITGDTEPVTETVNENGEISVTIKSPFKGQIYAQASDSVTNTCDFVTPKSAIVENDDNHDAETHIVLTRPETKARQLNGRDLYNNDVVLGMQIIDRYSGIRSVEWSVVAPYDQAKNQKGVLTIGNDGTLTGDGGWTKHGTDSNLVTEISKNITITNDSNDILITIKMTDRAGNETTETLYFGIDKTNPTVEYVFDNNTSDADYKNVFDAPRTLTIVVTERNFNANDFQPNVRNVDGIIPKISAWTDVPDATDPNKCTHTATITFRDDGHYTAVPTFTDRSGRAANIPQIPLFIIDQTKPIITVVFDNNNSHAGGFYNATRTATVTITERNFDVSRVVINGNATSVGTWTSQGNVHQVEVAYLEDGECNLTVSASDKARNAGIPYGEVKFIIDTKAPELTLEGVEDANSGDVAPIITITDKNLLQDSIEMTLVTMDGETVTRDYTTETFTEDDVEGVRYIFRNFDRTKDNDNIYTISVTAKDKAENAAKPIDFTFSVNRFGSTYDMSELNSINGKYLREIGDISFTELNIDDINQDAVDIIVSVNGTSRKLEKDKDFTIEVLQDGDKSWSKYRYTIYKSVFTADGDYSILVVSVDAAGNVNENADQNPDGTNGQISFCLDRVEPIIIVISPEDDKTYASVALEASAEIRDNYKLKDVKIYLDDEELSYSVSGNLYSFTIPEFDTAKTLRIVAEDEAGNVHTTEVKNILVSTNMFARFINNTGAVVGTSAGLAVILGIIFFILFKRRKKNA